MQPLLDPMNPAFKGKRPEERHQIILLAILGELRALNEAMAKKPQPRKKDENVG